MQFFPAQLSQAAEGLQLPSLSRSKTSGAEDGGFEALFERVAARANSSESKESAEDTARTLASIRNREARAARAAAKAHASAAESSEEAAQKAKDKLSGKAVTKEDFAALKDALSAYGFSDAEIATLQDRVNAGGLDWSSFLETLSAKAGPQAAFALRPGLTPELRENLASLFGKLGMSPEKSAKLLKGLEDGDLASAWEAVGSALQGLTRSQAASIDPKELRALSTALGLSASVQQKLTGMINGLAKGNFSKEQLTASLTAIGKDVTEMQALLDDDDTANLRERLAEVFKDSNRLETLARAGRHETKNVEQVRTLIEKAAKEGTDGMDPAERKAAQAAAQGAVQNAAKAMDGESLHDHPLHRTGDAGTNGGGTTAPQNGQAAANAKDQGTTQNGAQHNGAEQSKDEKSWNALWGRVGEQNEHTGKTDAATTRAEAAEFAAQQAVETARQSAEKASATLRQAKLSPESVLGQVKNGMMKTLAEGGKELTLRLDPPELGKLTVILQVHNKEVTATIRTENHEVSKAVGDQLSHLKASLEAQGLKVDKLEVQTELPRDASTRDWQGENSHNLAREREARERMRNRIRVLRSEGSGLVQEMQNVNGTARITHDGLDVFA
ncbi:MAG: flagellar hook-length control protein FliK [Desulfovibrionaceae bacterium]|jgi:flagellar hook-length control protein FliK|nr:flagellar hook-length control protein FliK [Desulfovibrionaceae bacterium]